MREALLEHFGELAEWNIPEGGLFFWLTSGSRWIPAPCSSRRWPPMSHSCPANLSSPSRSRTSRLRLNFSHVAPERLHGLAAPGQGRPDAQAAEAA